MVFIRVNGLDGAAGMKQFSQRVRRWTEERVPDVSARLLFKIHRDVLKGIVRRTPVGDPSLWQRPAPPGYKPGRAMATWYTQIGSPSGAVRRQTDPVGNGLRKLRRWRDRIKKSKLTRIPEVHFTNNSPYIVALEKGHSTQAPLGMVRVTLEEVRQTYG